MDFAILCILHTFFLVCFLPISNAICTDMKDCFRKLRRGKLDGYVIKTFTNKGYRDCFNECFRHESICRSFNYNKFTGLCELNSEDDTTKWTEGAAFVNSMVPSAKPNDLCVRKPCLPSQMCVVLSSEATTCVNALRCTFEDDCRFWVSDENEPFFKESGPTTSDETGCESDHTTEAKRKPERDMVFEEYRHGADKILALLGSGYYYYLEATDMDEGGKAIIKTIYQFPAGQRQCLELWYYMYGVDVGRLYLKVSSATGESEKIVAEGEQGEEWHYWTITIDDLDSRSTLAITGERGADSKSDICIDDVMIYKC